MKNILNKSRIIGLVMLSIIFTNCDAVLDQDLTDFGKGPILVQFQETEIEAEIEIDGKIQTYDVALAIIGGKNEPLNEAVTIEISVDPSSTAVSGNEYTLEKKSYTIPAGQLTVNVPIMVNSAKLDPDNEKELVLKIESSSKRISEKNKTTIYLIGVE